MNILKVNNLSKSFPIESGIFKKKIGEVKALDEVSFELAKGSVLGILGESGSGKTTLGKIICKFIKPDSGQILINEKDLNTLSRQELAGKVQMIFQDPFTSLNPKLKIKTMLLEAASFCKPDKRMELIETTLNTVGLQSNILNEYPHQFSGGQRQRIAIARAIIRNPEIIIADEPLSSLDVSIQNQLLDIFINLKQIHSVSFIFISHDIVSLSCLSDNILVLHNGKIVEQGSAESIILNPQHTYTKRLIASVPKG